MQQHTRPFWTHLVVLCSLEKEGGAAILLVGKLYHQTLSSKSGILWIYGAFKTTGNSGKKTKSIHDVSDLQVGALERG